MLTCCLKIKQVGMTFVLFLASFQAKKKVLTYDIRSLNEANTCKYQNYSMTVGPYAR